MSKLKEIWRSNNELIFDHNLQGQYWEWLNSEHTMRHGQRTIVKNWTHLRHDDVEFIIMLLCYKYYSQKFMNSHSILNNKMLTFFKDHTRWLAIINIFSDIVFVFYLHRTERFVRHYYTPNHRHEHYSFYAFFFAEKVLNSI